MLCKPEFDLLNDETEAVHTLCLQNGTVMVFNYLIIGEINANSSNNSVTTKL